MEAATKASTENHPEDQNLQNDSTSNADPEEELLKLEQKKKALENELKQVHQQEENKDEQNDLDERSIFVKNVHFSATDAEIREHFQECGEIKRVTILFDKALNQPKGQVYIEFASQEGVMKSMRLNETLFRGRQITIMPKRKNVPGRGRGGGFRGGARNPMMQLANMMQVLIRGTGRGFRRGRPF